METRTIDTLNREVSRIGLGAWAIGGFMWGGTDEKDSIGAILAALDKGIDVIDTAPAYGFGKSEELVGRALKEWGKREEVVVSTKCGLEWDEEGNIVRNSTRERIMQEIDDSLRRLQTDYVDIYFIHWPDPLIPCDEAAETMNELFRARKIRAIGVSNFTVKQMDAFRQAAPLAIIQPPFNLFELEFELQGRPYSEEHGIATMTYGTLCRGLLSGHMSKDREFKGDDLRQIDPKFREPRFNQYLAAAEQLDAYIRKRYGRGVAELAVRWVLDHGADIALWGARRPEQLEPLDGVQGLTLTDEDNDQIEKILQGTIKDPVGPEFMAPPPRPEARAG